MSVLVVDNLTKKYRSLTALDGISLRLEQGRIYGLVGNNGAGKTTLFRIIMGLTFPTSGSIELLGGVSKLEVRKARKKIGALIEEPYSLFK